MLCELDEMVVVIMLAVLAEGEVLLRGGESQLSQLSSSPEEEEEKEKEEEEEGAWEGCSLEDSCGGDINAGERVVCGLGCVLIGFDGGGCGGCGGAAVFEDGDFLRGVGAELRIIACCGADCIALRSVWRDLEADNASSPTVACRRSSMNVHNPSLISPMICLPAATISSFKGSDFLICPCKDAEIRGLAVIGPDSIFDLLAVASPSSQILPLLTKLVGLSRLKARVCLPP